MKTLNLVAAIKTNLDNLKGDFVAVDKGLESLLTTNYNIKALIGDLDSVNNKLIDNLDFPIIKLNPIKDETDLEYAIKLYYDEYDIINVYGAIGQRLDHTLTNLNLLKKYPKLVFYDDYSEIRVLKAGEHTISLNFKYVSIYAIKANTIISLKNFKYLLDNYKLELDDTLCISNEVYQDNIIINNKDIIIIMVY